MEINQLTKTLQEFIFEQHTFEMCLYFIINFYFLLTIIHIEK